MTDNINYKHIVDFLDKTLPAGDGILGELEQYAVEHCTPIIQKEVRCFIDTLLECQKPHRILEIGTAIGYSGIFFAQHLPENGELITLERDTDYAERAKANFSRSGVGNKITLIVGEAEESVTKLTGEFDLIFIDANKSKYRYYFDELFPKLRVGGMIICDNILYKGYVTSGEYLSAKQRTIVNALKDFLPFLANHPKLATSIIPIGDGVTVSVKKEN